MNHHRACFKDVLWKWSKANETFVPGGPQFSHFWFLLALMPSWQAKKAFPQTLKPLLDPVNDEQPCHPGLRPPYSALPPLQFVPLCMTWPQQFQQVNLYIWHPASRNKNDRSLIQISYSKGNCAEASTVFFVGMIVRASQSFIPNLLVSYQDPGWLQPLLNGSLSSFTSTQRKEFIPKHSQKFDQGIFLLKVPVQQSNKFRG